jgi:hypothetical protein
MERVAGTCKKAGHAAIEAKGKARGKPKAKARAKAKAGVKVIITPISQMPGRRIRR